MSAAPSSPGADEPGPGCLVALRIFDSPSRELLRTLKPPWPRSLERLYELEQAATAAVDVGNGVITVGAAVSALKEEIAQHLDVLAFVVSALEELGWDVRLEGEALLARANLTPAEAREQLDDHGIAGPMCLVADLDDSGWPWIRSADTPIAAG
jgi:hypothetical protein